VEAAAAATGDASLVARLDSIEATLARLERSARSTRNGVLLSCALLAVVLVTCILAWLFPPPLSVRLGRQGESTFLAPSSSQRMLQPTTVTRDIPAPVDSATNSEQGGKK
jgi:hypothetical protein